jgi:hypothetical protein
LVLNNDPNAHRDDTPDECVGAKSRELRRTPFAQPTKVIVGRRLGLILGFSPFTCTV